MRVPLQWLREYAPDITTDMHELEQLMSISGTKVEAIHEFGVPAASNGNGAGFKVGRVVSFEKHPNADKLRLCKVDVGEGDLRQIVCGASNFAEGDTVAVVLPGSTMPGGFQIKPAKLRGEESHGMMLSERELELSTDHSGIMILPADWTPGAPLADHVPLGDTVIELEITPNRPDCLGVFGVAREVAAVTGTRLVDAFEGDAEATGTGTVTDVVTVRNEAPDLCPRYMARAFTGITVGTSPYWMRARLAAAGMRAINTVVDITNYVMLLTGQPLHAFDADRIGGNEIIVRRANAGEKVTTLDDVERKLEPWMLSIADASQTAVIAGVMGADAVEVHDGTTRIVLEAACFDGPTIQKTSMKLGLRSESSARFEKGLDPHLPEVALRLASKLFVELCGAQMVPGTIDATGPDGIAAPPVIGLRETLASEVIGLDIAPARVEEILGALGYETAPATVTAAGVPGWNVTVPHWRMFDTTRPIDLVEEIARVNGLEHIPATLPARGDAIGALTVGQRLQRTVEDTAASLGLAETYTYAFVATGTSEAFGAAADEVIAISNPMTSEHGELRTTLLPSLLDVVQRNRSAGTDDVALFEIGRTFRRVAAGAAGADGLPRFADERRVAALCCAGALHGGRFDAPAVEADFASVAGLVQSIVTTAGAACELRPFADGDAAVPGGVHPGQVAAVMSGDVMLGWVATVHPSVTKARHIRGTVVAAEIDLHRLESVLPALHTYTAISTFPPVRQDIALVLPEDVLAGDVLATVRAAGAPLLEHVRVFDRYVGDQVAAGHTSLALKLTFRAPDRTLTDDEVAVVRAGIVQAAVDAHGASLRDGA